MHGAHVRERKARRRRSNVTQARVLLPPDPSVLLSNGRNILLPSRRSGDGTARDSLLSVDSSNNTEVLRLHAPREGCSVAKAMLPLGGLAVRTDCRVLTPALLRLCSRAARSNVVVKYSHNSASVYVLSGWCCRNCIFHAELQWQEWTPRHGADHPSSPHAGDNTRVSGLHADM